MRIFGDIGDLNRIYRRSFTHLCVDLYKPKNMQPKELASAVWDFIDNHLDPLSIPQESQSDYVDRVANAILKYPNEMQQLARSARRGDSVAKQHIADLVESYNRQGKPLPEPFVKLFSGVLKGGLSLAKPKGRPKKTVRDQKIAMLLEVLLKCHPNLKPFRSEIKRIREEPASSACSIVQEMLQKNRIYLSEKAIESIFSNYCQILK